MDFSCFSVHKKLLDVDSIYLKHKLMCKLCIKRWRSRWW